MAIHAATSDALLRFWVAVLRLPHTAGPAFAQQSAKGVVGAVRIGSNECWTGPLPPA